MFDTNPLDKPNRMFQSHHLGSQSTWKSKIIETPRSLSQSDLQTGPSTRPSALRSGLCLTWTPQPEREHPLFTAASARDVGIIAPPDGLMRGGKQSLLTPCVSLGLSCFRTAPCRPWTEREDINVY